MFVAGDGRECWALATWAGFGMVGVICSRCGGSACPARREVGVLEGLGCVAGDIGLMFVASDGTCARCGGSE